MRKKERKEKRIRKRNKKKGQERKRKRKEAKGEKKEKEEEKEEIEKKQQNKRPKKKGEEGKADREAKKDKGSKRKTAFSRKAGWKAFPELKFALSAVLVKLREWVKTRAMCVNVLGKGGVLESILTKVQIRCKNRGMIRVKRWKVTIGKCVIKPFCWKR